MNHHNPYRAKRYIDGMGAAAASVELTYIREALEAGISEFAHDGVPGYIREAIVEADRIRVLLTKLKSEAA